MKICPPKGLFRIAFCATVCAILVGCDKPQTPGTPTIAPVKPPADAATSELLKWNLASTVDIYPVAGHANPAWDEQAKLALTAFARIRSHSAEPNENAEALMSSNCVAAVNAGCSDPLIQYLHLRFRTDHVSKKEGVDAYCKAALDMEFSSYPKIRKFYAWHRAGQQINKMYGYGTNVPAEFRALSPWNRSESNLVEALADRTMPPAEAYDACHEILEVWENRKERYSFLYHTFEEQFPAEWKNDPMILLLKGEAYVKMAWHARGNGYVNSVTDAGWKLFADRLDVAEKALTNAWELDPKEPRIALKMMNVELGQGEGRERMELWFHRAMELDPKYYDACSLKLYYLEPKWYGSIEDMLAFGRECVQNTNWGGHIPLILMDAHVTIHKEFAEESRKANYWEELPVSGRTLKSAFDRFLELNPKEISW